VAATFGTIVLSFIFSTSKGRILGGRGEIASGDQMMKDPSIALLARVLKMWPRINAVETKGAGAAAAIERAASLGIAAYCLLISASGGQCICIFACKA